MSLGTQGREEERHSRELMTARRKRETLYPEDKLPASSSPSYILPPKQLSKSKISNKKEKT